MSDNIYISDLVQYKNRQSLERSDLIGYVIGSSPQGRAYVLWLHPGGKLTMELHQKPALRVLERLQDIPTLTE